MPNDTGLFHFVKLGNPSMFCIEFVEQLLWMIDQLPRIISWSWLSHLLGNNLTLMAMTKEKHWFPEIGETKMAIVFNRFFE